MPEERKAKTLDDVLRCIPADERRRSRVTAENIRVSKKEFNVISVYPRADEDSPPNSVSTVIMNLIKKVSL